MEDAARYYRFGGVTVALQGPSFRENAFLRPFRCESAAPDAAFAVSVGHPAVPKQAPVKQTLHEAEYLQNGRRVRVIFREHSAQPLLTQEETEPGRYRVCLEEACLPLYDNNLVLKLWDLPKLLTAHGGIFLHASFVSYGGQAILFTAPKQTGKSTQAALWEHYRGAEIVNGDRALLRKTGGVWMAYGSPYCGTSGICKNRALPVAAIVLLAQAEKNSVRPATPREAAAAFLDGCTYDPETQTGTVLDFALQLWKEQRMLCLGCRPEESAVSCLENALSCDR